MKKLASFDKTLIFIVLILSGIGLVMVYSASAAVSIENYKDSEYFFKKQLMWYLTGVIVMIITGCINYKYLKTLSIPAVLFTFFLCHFRRYCHLYFFPTTSISFFEIII